MRVIFAGTPEAAVPTLKLLIASKHEVVAVLTRPPARMGRGRTLHPSPVAQVAADHGINTIETSSLKNENVRAQIAAAQAEIGVVIAYGAIIPHEVLTMPNHGWINLHFSDLPRWRGAAPVQRAILFGDTHTASCVFQVEEKLDTGDVYSRIPVEIGHETSGELLTRMAILGAPQVLAVLDTFEDGTAHKVPQGECPPGDPAAYANMLTSDEGFVDFLSPASSVDQKIRAFTPNPGAWTLLPNGKRMKLGAVTLADDNASKCAPGQLHITTHEVQVGCLEGNVILHSVAPAGKAWMDASAWARGAHLKSDAVLGIKEGHENK